MKTSARESHAWGADLCHPVPLGAVVVLALNDHVLKGAGWLPGWLTGKLSDVAGLFFFPMLLVALAQGLAVLLGARVEGWRRRWLCVGAVALTGVVFAAVKLSPGFNAWVGSAWGFMVRDPGDLVALPVLGLSWWWLVRRGREVVV